MLTKIIIPELFIKRLVKNIKTEEELKEEIKRFADFHSQDYEEVLYFFIQNILSLGIYFKTKKEFFDEILFEVIYWASIKETKKKTRPKNIKGIPSDKVDNYYTKLQKEMILALSKEYQDRKMLLEIELNRYLLVFYELSCIKRDRR